GASHGSQGLQPRLLMLPCGKTCVPNQQTTASCRTYAGKQKPSLPDWRTVSFVSTSGVLGALPARCLLSCVSIRFLCHRLVRPQYRVRCAVESSANRCQTIARLSTR